MIILKNGYEDDSKGVEEIMHDITKADSENQEKCIGRLIHSRIPIEWMRYNMYIEDDRYRNIPMLVFRVQDSCPSNIIDSLKECCEGRVQYNQRDFFGAEKYKEYCDDAIQDIPRLAKHIAEKLRDNDEVF